MGTKNHFSLVVKSMVLSLLGLALLSLLALSAAPSAQAQGPRLQVTITVIATNSPAVTLSPQASGTASVVASRTVSPVASGTASAVASGTVSPVASGTVSPVASGTAGIGTAVPTTTGGPTGFDVSPRFRAYYDAHDGLRLLGYAVANETTITQDIEGQRLSIPVQYFQKARLEDHRGHGYTGEWAFAYGLLVPALIERGADLPISNSVITYRQLKTQLGENPPLAPPAGFKGGTMMAPDGSYVFVPQSPNLGVAPGYRVPINFWNYLNSTVFPAGWLHDLGLPISNAFQTSVNKQGQDRAITMQAFERGVLTYDPQNPADFQVERANVGYDYLQIFGNSEPTPSTTGTAVSGTPVGTGTAVATGTVVGTRTAVATGTAVGTRTAVATGTVVGTGTAVATTSPAPSRTP